ncbi:MAG: exodeoxyribonuclease VII small subunit [Saprospiraceae bacterium]|jgi:exodeoxyribonuclease VII small subunit
MTPNNYDEALRELQQWLDKLQSGEMNLQEMKQAMKRSAELIRYCREELRKTQSEMDDLLESLDGNQ